jgi:hypothetical protein
MQLGQILLKKRWISPGQLEEALNIQSVKQCRLGELLIQKGAIMNEQLDFALQEQHWRRKGFWVID